MDEFVTFALITQTRTYRAPKQFGDSNLPQPIRVEFKHGQNYRVSERLMCNYEDGERGSYTEYTVFLEHPDLPGVRFGFPDKNFNYQKQIRSQRSRQTTPGIPIGHVYVGRPSQWGNPARIGTWYDYQLVNNKFLAVSLFYDRCKHFASNDPVAFAEWLRPLVNRNLCCWCAIDQPCHGDILLALCRHLRPILFHDDFRTLIPASVETWPEISCIIVM